jgi:hypothetical protein
VRGQYADFGPTLAHEKLVEVHGIPISRTTVRKWMIGDGLWTTRRERNKRVYQPRYRRACVGELVQIDGCEFPARGNRWGRGYALSVYDAVDSAMLAVWVKGWTLARETAPPVAIHDGFLVSVGWPTTRHL